MEVSKEPILEVADLTGARLSELSFSLLENDAVVLHSSNQRALEELVDMLFGFKKPVGGRVGLFGENPQDVPESVMLSLLEQIGYASRSEEMISNLPVWENLTLPIEARCGRLSNSGIATIEDEMMEAFEVVDFDEARVVRLTASAPDMLNTFETTVCSLVRCHLSGFKLLVCENLHSGVGVSGNRKLDKLINWMGPRHPGSGLLVLHHGEEDDLSHRLTAWPQAENISL